MNKSVLITAVLMLLIGIGIGSRLDNFLPNTPAPMEHKDIPADRKQQARQVLFYRHPMNPTVTSAAPAKDSMGMDYIPVYAADKGDEKSPAGSVKIDGTMVQNIGVRTAKAVQSTLTHTVRAVGRVAFDEERMVHLHPKTEGWI